jgi:hypothetical protein
VSMYKTLMEQITTVKASQFALVFDRFNETTGRFEAVNEPLNLQKNSAAEWMQQRDLLKFEPVKYILLADNIFPFLPGNRLDYSAFAPDFKLSIYKVTLTNGAVRAYAFVDPVIA